MKRSTSWSIRALERGAQPKPDANADEITRLRARTTELEQLLTDILEEWRECAVDVGPLPDRVRKALGHAR